MSNITILIFSIIFFLWIYSLASILSSEFKNKDEKIFWSLAVIFVPILAVVYLFAKKDMIEHKTS